MRGLTIGELARGEGIPTSTVRYYERAGLMTPTRRTMGNYRIYDEQAADRLRFVRAAQATGFTLDDIKSLLQYRDGSTAPCKEVRVLIEKRLVSVRERMGQFRHVEKVLRGFLSACRKSDQEAPCHVMERLDPGPPAGATRSRHARR